MSQEMTRRMGPTEPFVIVCDPKHFFFFCFIFYVLDQRAYFVSAIAPVLKIIDRGRRHPIVCASLIKQQLVPASSFLPACSGHNRTRKVLEARRREGSS